MVVPFDKLIYLYRLEFDAYRNEMEALQLAPKESSTPAKVEASKRKFDEHKQKFEKLRGDVSIKLKFLDENRVRFSVFSL